MASLIRALSWPLISPSPQNETNEKNCNENLVNRKGKAKTATFQQLVAARRLICRRYYPEGNFGWIILCVGVVVNILTHGLQLCAPEFLILAGQRFKVEDIEVNCLGKWIHKISS